MVLVSFLFLKQVFLICLYIYHGQNSNIVRYYFHFKITIFYVNIMSNVIYSSDAKLNFQHHPSEISLIWSTFDYQCWKQLWYLFIFCGNYVAFFYGFFDGK